MKISFNYLIYIPFILLFLPAFAVNIPGIGIYAIFYIALYVALAILIAKDYKAFVSKINRIIKSTPLKYFLIGIGIFILDSIILSFFGITTFEQTFRSIILRVVLRYFAVFAFFIYVIDKYISYEKFFKFFVFLFWINLVIGFISYIGQFFNIEFINLIFDFFANQRLITANSIGLINSGNIQSNYTSFGLPRLDNLCEEPSFYARFLFMYLPFTYVIANSKVRIFKNFLFNKIAKSTLIPFVWISVILTQSPIYLVLFLIITLIYYYKQIIKFLIKFWYIFVFSIFTVVIVLNSINFEDSYLSRILNILSNVKTFEDLIIIEPSLATRFSNFYNSLCVFLKFPLTGVGIANLPTYQLEQMIKSSLTLTPENMSQINFAIANKVKIHFNSALIYDLLASGGVIIFGIYAYFHILLFTKLKKISKIKLSPLLILNAKALSWAWISTTILMFYHILQTHLELIFLQAFIICTIYKAINENKLLINYRKNQDEKNYMHG